MLAHELGELSVAEEHYVAALEPGHGQFGALFGCALLAVVRASGPMRTDAPGLLARSWRIAGSSRSAPAFLGLAEALAELALAAGDGEPQRAAARALIRQFHEPGPAEPGASPLPPVASTDHDLRVLIRIAETYLRETVGVPG